jgi:MscS family membrane protein
MAKRHTWTHSLLRDRLGSIAKSETIKTKKYWNFPAFSFCRFIATLLFFLTLFCVPISELSAQQKDEKVGKRQVAQTRSDSFQYHPVLTDSPRDTMATFLRLRTDLEKTMLSYLEDATRDAYMNLQVLTGQLISLVDFSSIPRPLRREVGRDTIGFLLDSLGRVELPDLESIPNAETLTDKSANVKWRVPGTPIHIARIGTGLREGEFLFTANTVLIAPRFFRGIKDKPLNSSLEIKSWQQMLLEITSPTIPAWLVRAIPESLKGTWYGTPAWKALIVLLIYLFAGLLIGLLNRFVARKEISKKIVSLCWQLLLPLSIAAFVLLLGRFIDFNLIISGAFSRTVNFTESLLIYISFAWMFWIAVRIFFEWLILSPHISEESLNANLLRLMAAFIGIVGITIILAYGGEKLGLPTLSLLAGLGIGGIAVALAIRPTLENLIGGVILYMDKPVRVGDLCSFGDQMGRVESIGVRSTQFRALDRTQISIPNAQFVDMQLVNWAKCDQMLIEETIGLRYETSPDQLRYVLAKLREMLHAHPRIDNDTIRVRFSGFGDSSLNITMRVYANTRDRNEFHTIREDIFMRTLDMVIEAGSSFAFPSQTVYMGQDNGLDQERTKAAVDEVEKWRKSSRLPFPRMSAEWRDQIEDTLDYPPRGSPEASGEMKLNPDHTKHPSTKRIRPKDDGKTNKRARSTKSKRR